MYVIDIKTGIDVAGHARQMVLDPIRRMLNCETVKTL